MPAFRPAPRCLASDRRLCLRPTLALSPALLTAIALSSRICRGPLLWTEPLPLLWLACGAPLLEEWVFRAGLQDYLLHRASRRLLPGARVSLHTQALAIGMTAVPFALLHLARGIDTALMVLPMTLLSGWLYQNTRSWFACAGLHSTANVLAWLACLGNPP